MFPMFRKIRLRLNYLNYLNFHWFQNYLIYQVTPLRRLYLMYQHYQMFLRSPHFLMNQMNQMTLGFLVDQVIP
jgi:hypothetical protein